LCPPRKADGAAHHPSRKLCSRTLVDTEGNSKGRRCTGECQSAPGRNSNIFHKRTSLQPFRTACSDTCFWSRWSYANSSPGARGREGSVGNRFLARGGSDVGPQVEATAERVLG
jgi:hypothetical protein